MTQSSLVSPSESWFPQAVQHGTSNVKVCIERKNCNGTTWIWLLSVADHGSIKRARLHRGGDLSPFIICSTISLELTYFRHYGKSQHEIANRFSSPLSLCWLRGVESNETDDWQTLLAKICLDHMTSHGSNLASMNTTLDWHCDRRVLLRSSYCGSATCSLLSWELGLFLFTLQCFALRRRMETHCFFDASWPLLERLLVVKDDIGGGRFTGPLPSK